MTQARINGEKAVWEAMQLNTKRRRRQRIDAGVRKAIQANTKRRRRSKSNAGVREAKQMCYDQRSR